MFEIFRKKRIDRYSDGASGYVPRTYEPAPPPKKEFFIRYSISETDTDIQYSDWGAIRFSRENKGAIPAQEDHFRKRPWSSCLPGIRRITAV